MPETTSKVASPCVSLCCLDENDVCMGCFRRLEEITGWHGMNDQQKRELITILEQRRAAANTSRFK